MGEFLAITTKFNGIEYHTSVPVDRFKNYAVLSAEELAKIGLGYRPNVYWKRDAAPKADIFVRSLTVDGEDYSVEEKLHPSNIKNQVYILVGK